MPNEMTAEEAAEMLEVLGKVSFCAAAREANACHYSETGCSDCKWQNAKNKIQGVLRRVASGELAEVKHSHWETNSDYPDTVICKCGYKEDVWWADTGTRYCPSCGALMDGKDDNDA